MENLRLLQLIESVVGKGVKKSKTNYAFHCPFCNHYKRKLEIDTHTDKDGNNRWHCWVCDTKGKKLTGLFKKLNAGQSKLSALFELVQPGRTVSNILTNAVSNRVILPDEYKPLFIVNNRDPEYKNAFNYVTKRGLSKQDILKYRIGYCTSGQYANMIIIPSYNNEGQLNYFTGRSYYDTDFKHKNPDVSKDIIGFELFINWNIPITLVEGGFDAVTVKRNVIPLFGKIVLDSLKKKIIEKRPPALYIALDRDALKKAIEIVEYFVSNGIEVHLVELDGKDPNELGFLKVTNLIKKSEPITFAKLMEYKLFVL